MAIHRSAEPASYDAALRRQKRDGSWRKRPAVRTTHLPHMTGPSCQVPLFGFQLGDFHVRSDLAPLFLYRENNSIFNTFIWGSERHVVCVCGCMFACMAALASIYRCHLECGHLTAPIRWCETTVFITSALIWNVFKLCCDMKYYGHDHFCLLAMPNCLGKYI